MLRVDASKPAPQPVRNSADIAAVASAVRAEGFFHEGILCESIYRTAQKITKNK